MPTVSPALFENWRRRLGVLNAEVRGRAAEDLLYCIRSAGPSSEFNGRSFAEAVQGQTTLLPGLVSLLREGREWHARTAVLCLVAIDSRPEIILPKLLVFFSRFSSQKPFRLPQEIVLAVTTLCGGPARVGPRIGDVLSASNATHRTDAATTLGMIFSFIDNRVEKQPDGSYLPPLADRQLKQGFWSSIPHLARLGASDPVPQVRLAALLSLDRLLYQSPPELWEQTLAPLAKAFRSSRLKERQGAGQILAKCPVSLWAVMDEIRPGLYDADFNVQVYSRVALHHIFRTDRARLTDRLLGELQRGGSDARRAARDLQALIGTLWGTVPFGTDEARLALRLEEARQDSSLKYLFVKGRSEEEERARLLSGVVAAFSQPDVMLQAELARVVLLVAQSTDSIMGHSFGDDIGRQRMPTLVAAIDNAISVLGGRNPDLTNRLRSVRTELHIPRPVL